MLLDAAVEARVPRFIPSDYCIDYTKLTRGNNRNLAVRREFQHRLDNRRYSQVAWTSVEEVLAEHLARAQSV